MFEWFRSWLRNRRWKRFLRTHPDKAEAMAALFNDANERMNKIMAREMYPHGREAYVRDFNERLGLFPSE